MTKTIKLTIFRFDDLDQELPAIQFDDGTWYFSAQAVCLFAELASKENASRWVKMNVPPQNRFDRLYRVSTALRLRATLAPNRRVKQSLELVQQSSKYCKTSLSL